MIKQRILKYLDFIGDSKYKFYQKTGFSNGFLDKEGSIGSDKCEKICYEYSDLSLDWLITGKGEMLKGDAPKIEAQDLPVEKKITSNEILKDGNKTIVSLEKTIAAQEKTIAAQEKTIAAQEKIIANLTESDERLKKTLEKENKHKGGKVNLENTQKTA